MLDAIKNMNESREEVKIATSTGIYKTLIPALMDWTWDVQDFSAGSNCSFVVQRAKELELEDVIGKISW